MLLSWPVVLLWGVGFLLSMTLTAVLFHPRTHTLNSFRWWIGTSTASSASLLLTYAVGASSLYFLLYWALAAADVCLQIAVLRALSRAALVRHDRWISGSRLRFTLLIVIAVGLSCVVSAAKPVGSNTLDNFYARVSLCTSVLFCFANFGIMQTSASVGASWTLRNTQISYGLVFWNLTAFGTDALHYTERLRPYFSSVEFARSVLFASTLLYWIFVHLKAGGRTAHDLSESAALIGHQQLGSSNSLGGT